MKKKTAKNMKKKKTLTQEIYFCYLFWLHGSDKIFINNLSIIELYYVYNDDQVYMIIIEVNLLTTYLSKKNAVFC